MKIPELGVIKLSPYRIRLLRVSSHLIFEVVEIVD
jgi:hypothetical protein